VCSKSFRNNWKIIIEQHSQNSPKHKSFHKRKGIGALILCWGTQTYFPIDRERFIKCFLPKYVYGK
jgi:hypothetical protein